MTKLKETRVRSLRLSIKRLAPLGDGLVGKLRENLYSAVNRKYSRNYKAKSKIALLQLCNSPSVVSNYQLVIKCTVHV